MKKKKTNYKNSLFVVVIGCLLSRELNIKINYIILFTPYSRTSENKKKKYFNSCSMIYERYILNNMIYIPNCFWIPQVDNNNNYYYGIWDFFSFYMYSCGRGTLMLMVFLLFLLYVLWQWKYDLYMYFVYILGTFLLGIF